MTARQAATRAAVTKAIEDELAAARKAANAAVLQHLDVGDRKAVTLDDGTAVGTVTVSQRGGGRTAKTFDERALLEHVKAHHPDEVEERVRPAFVSSLLTGASDVDGTAYSSFDGEELPGVEFVDVAPSAPIVTVRLTDEHREAIAAAWRAGALDELLGTTTKGLTP